MCNLLNKLLDTNIDLCMNPKLPMEKETVIVSYFTLCPTAKVPPTGLCSLTFAILTPYKQLHISTQLCYISSICR